MMMMMMMIGAGEKEEGEVLIRWAHTPAHTLSMYIYIICERVSAAAWSPEEAPPSESVPAHTRRTPSEAILGSRRRRRRHRRHR